MKISILFYALFIVLMLNSESLFAESKNDKYEIEEGDWLVTKMIIDGWDTTYSKFRGASVVEREINKESRVYWLKFTVRQFHANGDRMIDLEMIRYKALRYEAVNKTWYGYDSFYPDFKQGQEQIAKEKVAYEIVLSASNEVKKIICTGNHTIASSQISPITDFNTDKSTTTELINMDLLNLVVNRLFEAIHLKTPMILYPKQGTKLLLVEASFSIPDNACIQGAIGLSDTAKLFINGKYIEIDKNGQFKYSTRLQNVGEQKIKLGKNQFVVFLRPGDTLGVTISEEGSQKPFVFTGKAAANNYFANEMQGLIGNMRNDGKSFFFHKNGKEVDNVAYLATWDKARQEKDRLLKRNEHRASVDTKEYYRKEWLLSEAADKLYHLYLNNYKATKDIEQPFLGFPKDFFLSIDTLPIAVLANQGAGVFPYLKHFPDYSLAKLGVSLLGATLEQRYNLSLLKLKGEPLYRTLYALLSTHLKNQSQSENQRIKTYVDDFLLNCGDTSLTKEIAEIWDRSEHWKIGSKNPIMHIVLADGSTFSFEQYKGKVVCLISGNFFDEKELAGYARFMRRKESQQVQFVIASYMNQGNKNLVADNRYLFDNLKNVTIIELLGSEQGDNPDLSSHKWFFFDQWQRVIADHVSPSFTFNGDYREGDGEPVKIKTYLEEAGAAQRFSQEEKAEALKIFTWSGGSFLITCLLGGILYRFNIRSIERKLKTERKLKELEIKAIRSQMNPHFVFNALNSIQALITDNRLEEANLFLIEFSSLLRSVLQNADKNMVALEDELEMVVRYCKLEQLRFDFSYTIDVEGVETNMIEIPAMVIQPLVENAIVHGLTPLGRKGELQIKVWQQSDELVIAVIDNGSGLSCKKAEQSKGNNKGLKLVRERLYAFDPSPEAAILTVRNLIRPENKIWGVESLITLKIN